MDKRAVLAASAALLAAADVVAVPARAEQRAGPCITPPPAFPLTEANRVAGPALASLVTGQTIVHVRRNTNGGYSRVRRQLRDDGSLALLAQNGPTPEGPWKTATRVASTGSTIAGGREVGVWSLRGGYVCMELSTLSQGQTKCHAIHRQGGSLYARATSQPNCLDGDIKVQPLDAD